MANYLIHIFLLVFVLSGCNRSIGIGGDYEYRLRRAPDENCRYLKRQISSDADIEDADNSMSVSLDNNYESEDSTYKPEEVELKEKKKPELTPKLGRKTKPASQKPIDKKKSAKPATPAPAPSLSDIPQQKYSQSEAKNIIEKKNNEKVDLVKKSEIVQPITPPTTTTNNGMIDIPKDEAPMSSPPVVPQATTKPVEATPPAVPAPSPGATPPAVSAPLPKVESTPAIPDNNKSKSTVQPPSAPSRGNLKYSIEEKPMPRLPS